MYIRMMIDFNDREDIYDRLAELRHDTPARFGVMDAQNMVEHLALVMSISNGSNPLTCDRAIEKQKRDKQLVIHTPDFELPIGFRAPFLPPEPLPYKHEDLDGAIKGLRNEIDAFDAYFAEHPDAEPHHATMGPFTHAEWIIFHGKHFNHHFKQFDLL